MGTAGIWGIGRSGSSWKIEHSSAKYHCWQRDMLRWKVSGSRKNGSGHTWGESRCLHELISIFYPYCYFLDTMLFCDIQELKLTNDSDLLAKTELGHRNLISVKFLSGMYRELINDEKASKINTFSCWTFGTVNVRSFGIPKRWDSECQQLGILKFGTFELLGFWNVDVSTDWGIEILGSGPLGNHQTLGSVEG